MINQQLIDFIKQSLSQGATKEKITSDLISNGWTEGDIQDGFSSLETPPTTNPSPIISPISTISNEPIIIEENHSNKKPIILTVVILLALALGASGYYFRNDLPIVKDLIKSNNNKLEELTQNQIDQAKLEEIQSQQAETPVVIETTPVQDSSIKTEEVPISAPVVANNAVATKTSPINCNDEACFLNEIKTCSPTIYKSTKVTNIFGMFNETIKSTITLKGLNSSKKCVYESYVNDVSNLEYTPEMQAYLKSEIIKQGKNLTDEQMQEALKPSAEGLAQAKLSIGITTKCSFSTAYLTSLYTKWGKGEYSSEDMTPGNCTFTDSNGKELSTLASGNLTDNISTKSTSVSSNLNGNLEIEWGTFSKIKKPNDKDMWSMPIKIANNENKMVILYINGTGKGINWSWRVEDTLESGESKIINLEIDHYFFDEVAYSKKDINISAYECSKLSVNDAKDICLSEWGQDGKLSPWEVLKNKKDAGTPIIPTLISEKYFNFNSLTIPPSEISKEEYLK